MSVQTASATASLAGAVSEKISEPSLPMLPEEITLSWLSSCLGHQIKSIEVTEQILMATASKVFVTITYQDETAAVARPRHICVKGGLSPAVRANFGTFIFNLYIREAKFFGVVQPRLPNLAVPKSWWAGSNSEQGLVILDDLTKTPGFVEFGEPVRPWSVERLHLGIEQLAMLHGGTWGAQKAEYPYLPNDYDNVIMNLCALYPSLIHGEGRPPFPEIISSQERITAAIQKHYRTRNLKRFSCLVHADAHLGNTYIERGENGGERVCFMDWQTIHVGSAFHDVAYLIVGALTVEDRRAHEFEILDHYFATLAKAGGPKLTRDDEEVMTEYRKSMLSGFSWILTPFEMQNRERVFAMAERHNAALVDHETVQLVESLPDMM